MYSYNICRAWYNDSYTLMAEPIRALELHYPMIQFLMKVDMSQNKHQCAQKVRIGDQILKISQVTVVFNQR